MNRKSSVEAKVAREIRKELKQSFPNSSAIIYVIKATREDAERAEVDYENNLKKVVVCSDEVHQLETLHIAKKYQLTVGQATNITQAKIVEVYR